MSRDYDVQMNSLIPMVVEQTSKGDIGAKSLFVKILLNLLNSSFWANTAIAAMLDSSHASPSPS